MYRHLSKNLRQHQEDMSGENIFAQAQAPDRRRVSHPPLHSDGDARLPYNNGVIDWDAYSKHCLQNTSCLIISESNASQGSRGSRGSQGFSQGSSQGIRQILRECLKGSRRSGCSFRRRQAKTNRSVTRSTRSRSNRRQSPWRTRCARREDSRAAPDPAPSWRRRARSP